MKTKNRFLHLFMALVMLLSWLNFTTAAADDTVVVTLNVTNTPVRGDVVLEKKLAFSADFDGMNRVQLISIIL